MWKCSLKHFITRVFFIRPQVYGLAHDDWQVLFQKGDQQFSPITLSTAEENGYTISMTRGRYVFRMPYGQPDSTVTLVSYSLKRQPKHWLREVYLL